ncbi:MAG: endonuclease/exonuclease/phosphatase family protein, partial [bacterium]
MESKGDTKKRSSLGENRQAKINGVKINESLNAGIKYSGNNEDGNIKDINKFQVDYSKKGTAKCKKCSKLITKGKLRIGKSVPFKVGNIFQYFHIDCVFESFRKARQVANVITSTSEIDGFELITNEEKTRITTLIHEANATTAKLVSRPPMVKVQKSELMQESSKSRKTSLKSYNVPSIKIMFTNADQFVPSKMTELRIRIEKEKPLIIAVSEVKPKNSKEHSILDYEIPNYTLHPVNLDTDVYRGIAVYSHRSLDKSTVQIDTDSSFEEACLLEIRLRGGDKLLFGCCYRSPTLTQISDQNNKKLNQFLSSISKKTYSHKCIVGDFNFRHINWSSWTTPHNEDSAEALFIESLRDCFFHQHVEEATRRRGNDDPSLLDLVLTDEGMQVSVDEM